MGLYNKLKSFYNKKVTVSTENMNLWETRRTWTYQGGTDSYTQISNR